MEKKYFLLFLTFLILFNGCATFKSNQSYFEDTKALPINDDAFNLFLIGNTCKLEGNGSVPESLLKMQEQFSKANKNDILLFLGDNIYPKKNTLNQDENDENIKEILNKQLEIANTFPGKVLFIPGNYDWHSGLKELKNQEKIVEKKIGKNTFKPINGCPIDKVKISDDITLLIIDSYWYITNWDKHPTINDNCDIKTRSDFLDEVRSEIKKAEGKITLIALHHPMFTNGPHGGNYSFKDHFKPIPIIGTIKNILRTTTGIFNDDIYNEFYNDLRKNIIAAAQQNDKVIFISAHENNMQYIESNNLKQIISGSATKATAVKVKNKEDYGEGAKGYAVLNVHKNKQVEVQFFNTEKNIVSFKKEIFKKADDSKIIENFKIAEDSIVTSIYSQEETKKTNFYKFLWGNRFREYYSTEIKTEIVDLDTLKGGLKPIRKGGGTQSKTLHLEDKTGKRYVLRAMKKQASQFIQSAILKDQYVAGQFEGTTSEKFLEDVFTGSHPYAPFTISVLSNAISLAHLNPKLYYVPKQKALVNFNDEFGDELYLFEEHPSDGHSELASKNFTGKIISTFDMMKEVHQDESKIIDEKEFIKARLFDMLIGDADRHQDQWRWIEYKENGKTIYKPLPRDRDLAFSRMSDGFVFSTAVSLIPPARKFRKYEADLKDVKGFNMSGFPLDVAFISDSDQAVWDDQVVFIQNNITDEVIDEAFKNIPNEVNDNTIEEIKKLLKLRRSNLKKIADRYLKLVNKYAVLTATNKDDFIKIECQENGEVLVQMFRKKEGTIKDEFHHRTYHPKTTKEIWIYALDDDDTFKVVGKSKNIKIRLIGGQNNDEYNVENGKKVFVFDYKSKDNNLNMVKNAKIKLTDDYDTNVYDYRKLKNNINQFLPMLGFNPDDGIKLGVIDTYTTYGFERNPFTSKHQFGAFYYFATNGYELKYNSEFANTIGNLNLHIEANFHSPNFSLNFFGYGNETKNTDDDSGLDYNRVKVRELSLKPSLGWNSKRGSKIKLGISFESIEIHNTENRFIDEFNVLPNYVFDEVKFGGINLNYSFLNADNKAYPTIGLQFDLDLGYKNNLDDSNKSFVYLIPNLKIAYKLNSSGNLVFATNFKSHLNFGDGFEFYQAASIGGIDGLRGFRNQRFTGRNSFYQNTDLRYSFNRIKTQFLPIKTGIYGGFDYGRIWQDDEESDKWHNSYGGGFFINIVDMLSFNLGVFNSKDGIRVAFGLGFGF
ncbi:metallophosphoesterase [Flavobacterium sp. J27]|uniref:metallophosphoesterase n=1 Tax=Flavobacterium sp. J27 TaxID=2060419 RepID=UPI0010312F97|nr:metallophosphoesterase [Flavobacterium sp. J27]